MQLKNGQNVEGNYDAGSADYIFINVGSQTLKFPVGEVARVEFVAAVTQPASRNAAPNDGSEVITQLRSLRSIVEAGVSEPRLDNEITNTIRLGTVELMQTL